MIIDFLHRHSRYILFFAGCFVRRDCIFYCLSYGECSPVAVFTNHICSFSGKRKTPVPAKIEIRNCWDRSKKSGSCGATRLDDRAMYTLPSSLRTCIRRFCLRRSCISGAHTLFSHIYSNGYESVFIIIDDEHFWLPSDVHSIRYRCRRTSTICDSLCAVYKTYSLVLCGFVLAIV